MAWRASGTRCGRFIFMVAAGTIQTAFSKSISLQRANRNSPGRTNSSAESCKREARGRLAVVAFNRPQQRTELFGLRNGSAMLDFRRRQCTAQVDGDVSAGAPGRDRIAEDHAGDRAQPSGAFVASAQLELPQCMQQLGRRDLADRAVTEGGKRRFEQPPVLAQRGLAPLLAPLLVEELLGDLAERVAAGLPRDLLQPPLDAWILADWRAALREASRRSRASANVTCG